MNLKFDLKLIKILLMNNDNDLTESNPFTINENANNPLPVWQYICALHIITCKYNLGYINPAC